MGIKHILIVIKVRNCVHNTHDRDEVMPVLCVHANLAQLSVCTISACFMLARVACLVTCLRRLLSMRAAPALPCKGSPHTTNLNIATMCLPHVQCLLVDANPESALNEEAGRLLLEDYEEFARHARLMTSIHAHASKRGGPLTASGGNVSGQAAAAAAAGSADPTKPEGANSPAPKKAKAEGAGQAGKPAAVSAAAKVKKSLKRL